MTTQYTITFDSSRELPEDVILEHVGYSLRDFTKADGAKVSNFRITSKATARAHPFDGEELFDDDEPEGDRTRADNQQWREGDDDAECASCEDGCAMCDFIDSLSEGERALREVLIQAAERPQGERVGLDKTYPNLWLFLGTKRAERG